MRYVAFSIPDQVQVIDAGYATHTLTGATITVTVIVAGLPRAHWNSTDTCPTCYVERSAGYASEQFTRIEAWCGYPDLW